MHCRPNTTKWGKPNSPSQGLAYKQSTTIKIGWPMPSREAMAASNVSWWNGRPWANLEVFFKTTPFVLIIPSTRGFINLQVYD